MTYRQYNVYGLMTKKTIPFTSEKYLEMQQRCDFLQKELVEVMARLKVAREMGDLSENGAYKYAKFEISDIRRQLGSLKHLLTHGYVATKSNHNGQVGFGSKVTLQSQKGQMTFTLVSQFESDPQNNKLSDASPLGRAVLGRSAGDSVTVVSPSGELSYTIVKVE